MHALDPVFRAAFPMQLDGATFEYGGIVEGVVDRVVLRLVVGGDVREDQLSLDDIQYEPPDRVAALLAALASVLARASRRASQQTSQWACRPRDLFRTFAMKHDDIVAALEAPGVLDWLLAGTAPPAVTVEDVHAICREQFPLKAANELASLEYVSAECRNGGFRLVVRMIVWQLEADGETMSIRDVKEQELYCGDAALMRSPERFRAFVRGLERALARALCSPETEVLMPHDLFRSEVMRLATANTDDDFFKALSARSRLGKLMASGGPASPALASADDLAAICRARFPMRATDGALEFVEAIEDAGTLKLGLRTRVATETVGLAAVGAYDQERAGAFLDGLASALATIAIGNAPPSVLWFPEVLAKSTVITVADFAKALGTKSRLGKIARR